MANKNKKKRNRKRTPRPAAQGPATPASKPSGGGANQARRERKEEARALREAERKRAARAAALRRAAVISCVGLVIVAVLWWMQRATAPRPLPQAATSALTAAGCRYDDGPSGDTQGGQHLAAGASFAYPSVPATTGQHDPEWLPPVPRVYDAPVPETKAVHFLEHSGIIAYYRGGDGGVDQPVVERLASLANDSTNLIVAPRDDLPDDTAFSVTAWNKVANCGPEVTPEQASRIVSGFVEAFACTSNAPEPEQGEDC